MLHELSECGRRTCPRNRPAYSSGAGERRQQREPARCRRGPPRGKYRAQWNDDYHHAWHVLLTGEAHGYYRDYQRAPLHDIARALGSGFVYQGEASAHRGGVLRGEPSGKLAADRLRQLPAEPRPDRQPCAAATGLKPCQAADAIEAALAITLLAPAIADAVHGRGMGLEGAVSVLLRLPRRTRRRGTQGPAQGIRRRLCQIWRRDARSALGADRRSAVLDWDGERQAARRRTAGAGAASCWRCAGADHAAARRRGLRPCECG